MNINKIKFKNLFIVILNCILLNMLIFSAKLNIILCVSASIIYLVLYFTLVNKFSTLILTVNNVILIILLIANFTFFLIYKLKLMDYIGSVHEIKNFILSTKEWGIFVFCFIQFLEVIALPIPSFIIILAGVNIWGIFKTILICGITVVISSCIAFMIGKIWGAKTIVKIVGQKKYDTYKNILNKKTKLYLALMFIFPFFPDDLLCLLAGTTNLKLYEFFIISLFTRPLSIIVTALLGDYAILIFQKYSIKTLMIILACIIGLIVIINKNKEKIIKFIKLNILKIKKDNKSNIRP